MLLSRALIVGGIAAAGVIGSAGVAQAGPGGWAAIAVSYETGAIQTVYGSGSKERAESRALELCAQSTGSPCTLYQSFYDTCYAIGVGGNGDLRVELDPVKEIAAVKVQLALGITAPPGSGSSMPELPRVIGNRCTWG